MRWPSTSRFPRRGPVPSDQLERLARLPRGVVGDALRELVSAGLVELGPDTVERTPSTRRAGP